MGVAWHVKPSYVVALLERSRHSDDLYCRQGLSCVHRGVDSSPVGRVLGQVETLALSNVLALHPRPWLARADREMNLLSYFT